MHPVIALSIQDELERIGAYAGFAAIPGLAVLALLYFAQARELRRLREWAGRAPERAAELEERVSEQAAARAAGRVAGAPPAATGAVAARRPAAPPARPGAAPAPGPATAPGVVRPAAAPGPAGAAPAAAPPAAAPQPAKAPTAPGQPAAPGQPKPAAPQIPGQPAAKPGVPGPPAAKPPAPVPAGAPAAGPATGAPAPATAAAGAPATGRTVIAPRAPGQPARPASAPLRAGAPSATLPPTAPRRAGAPPPSGPAPRNGGDGSGPGRRRVPALLGAGGLALLVAALAFALLRGDDAPKQANRTAPPANTAAPAPGQPSAPVSRGQVTVSVLNGTTVPGLAAQVADELEQGGFKRGTVTNAADQQRAATTVAFATGSRRAGDEVAAVLKVRSVKPLDPNTQAIAGPDAAVVVTVGSDRTR